MNLKQPLILRNLDNSPMVYFIRHHLKLGKKEYLTCWKIIYVYIRPNWRYCLIKSLQCYRTNIVDLMWQGILHSFLLPLVPKDKIFQNIHSLPLTYNQANLKELYNQGLEVEVTTKDIKKEGRFWLKFSTPEA